MKKFAVTAVFVAFAGVALAAPAQAYDRELYSYAAGHMIEPSDIPAPLSVKKGADFSAYPTTGKSYLCGDENKSIQYAGGDHQFFMSYTGRKDGMGVQVSVNHYASDSAAIKAFNELKRKLQQCAGTANGQRTFEDGTFDTWSRLTTTGNVPLVTVAGVSSVFLNQNFDDVTSGEFNDRYSSDQYNVYTLVNNVIINTSHSTGSELNMSTKERRAVNQVAFNAVTRWLD